MALDKSAYQHYAAQLIKLNIPATDQAIGYLLMLQKYLRCPVCFRQANIQRGLLTCDKCHRGWALDDLILTLPNKEGIAPAVPASGPRHESTPGGSLYGVPPSFNDPHSQGGGGAGSLLGAN